MSWYVSTASDSSFSSRRGEAELSASSIGLGSLDGEGRTALTGVVGAVCTYRCGMFTPLSLSENALSTITPVGATGCTSASSGTAACCLADGASFLPCTVCCVVLSATGWAEAWSTSVSMPTSRGTERT